MRGEEMILIGSREVVREWAQWVEGGRAARAREHPPASGSKLEHKHGSSSKHSVPSKQASRSKKQGSRRYTPTPCSTKPPLHGARTAPARSKQPQERTARKMQERLTQPPRARRRHPPTHRRTLAPSTIPAHPCRTPCSPRACGTARVVAAAAHASGRHARATTGEEGRIAGETCGVPATHRPPLRSAAHTAARGRVRRARGTARAQLAVAGRGPP